LSEGTSVQTVSGTINVGHSESFGEGFSVSEFITELLAGGWVLRELGFGGLARGIDLISESRAELEFAILEEGSLVWRAGKTTSHQSDLVSASLFNSATIRRDGSRVSSRDGAAGVGVVPCALGVFLSFRLDSSETVGPDSGDGESEYD
jgi:hypothetical protein